MKTLKLSKKSWIRSYKVRYWTFLVSTVCFTTQLSNREAVWLRVLRLDKQMNLTTFLFYLRYKNNCYGKMVKPFVRMIMTLTFNRRSLFWAWKSSVLWKTFFALIGAIKRKTNKGGEINLFLKMAKVLGEMKSPPWCLRRFIDHCCHRLRNSPSGNMSPDWNTHLAEHTSKSSSLLMLMVQKGLCQLTFVWPSRFPIVRPTLNLCNYYLISGRLIRFRAHEDQSPHGNYQS